MSTSKILAWIRKGRISFARWIVIIAILGLVTGCDILLTQSAPVGVDPCAAAPNVVQNLADGLNAMDREAILNVFAPRYRVVLSIAWPMLTSRLNEAGISFEVSDVHHECTLQEPNSAMLRIWGTVTVFDRTTGEIRGQYADHFIDAPLVCDANGCFLTISITDLLKQVGIEVE